MCTGAESEPSPNTRTEPSQEVMDLEGVRLEEGQVHPDVGAVRLEEGEVHLEDSQLSLSFQGYVAELRQCQSKMKMKVQGAEHGGRRPPGATDCTMDLYKATVV